MRKNRLFLLVLLLGLGGCQAVGALGGRRAPEATSEPTVPLPQGSFQGFLEIEGGRINGELTLTPRGGTELEGSFESPPDFMAMGRGSFRDEEFRFELRYQGECRGKMTLVGRWEARPGTLSGAVRADDCTGKANGTFLFRLDQNSFLLQRRP